MNEAETCRTLVRPRLEQAGWDDTGQHLYREQLSFTDGRVVAASGQPKRLKKKYADFLLYYTRDVVLAVVEAKTDSKPAGTGMQQAKEYAEILGLEFAYATNGTGIVEYDYFTSQEREIDRFPTPAELWARYQQGMGLTAATTSALLVPYNLQSGKPPRYYQRIAIDRAVQSIVSGHRRCLLMIACRPGCPRVKG